MAPSRASVIAAAALASTLAAAAVPELDQNAPIHLAARTTDVDYKNSTLAVHTVRISQGAVEIEADEATAIGLDFTASQWTLRGHVKITTPDGSLNSDEAHIAFVANAVTTAQITGAPASFVQKRDNRVAHGHANHIDYDFKAATVRLTDNAYLSDGDHEISGRTLIYDMREQRVRASADEQNMHPVEITIIPKKQEPKPNP